MTGTGTKKIGTTDTKIKPTHNAWEVMKPFVHFGFKATALIAQVLIAIVKSIPKPGSHHHPGRKNDKIIKI